MIPRSALVLLIPILTLTSPAGPTTILVTDQNGHAWRVSSDGTISALPFEFSDGLCAGHIAHGTTCPVPSPDGLTVAFTRENDLWLYGVESGDSRRVTRVGRPEDERYASVFVYVTAWSPDGTRILHHVVHGEVEDVEGARPDLEVRPADYGPFIHDQSSGTTAAVTVPGSYLAWLPDGALLLSSPDPVPVERTLLTVTPGDGGPVPLPLPRGWYGQVDVRHDGAEILASVTRKVPDGVRTQLVRLDVATGGMTEITPPGQRAQYPLFSPSGAHVSYLLRVSHGRGPPEFLLMVDGKPIHRRTDDHSMPRYRWIDDSSLAVLENNERTILVLDRATGEERSRYEFETGS